MAKRDVWTPGRAFYMTAGEIEDGGVRASGFPAFMQRVDAPDELTARYRAAVAARMEEEHA